MELSFLDGSPAEKSRFAKELLNDLKDEGLKDFHLSRTSGEAMDLGSVIEGAAHALYAAGYLAIFGKCVYEFLGKHATTIRIKMKDGNTVEIPNNVDFETVKTILRKLDKESGA